jgi:hypothetical protein
VGRRTRALAGVAVVVAGAAGIGWMGTATPQALPVVSIVGATEGEVTDTVDACAVADEPAPVSSTPMVVTFERDQTVGALTVPISVTLDTNSFGHDLPTEATFADGEASTTVQVALLGPLLPQGATQVTTSLVADASYTVGSPDSATAPYVHTTVVTNDDVVQVPGLAFGDYDCGSVQPADPESRVLARTG